MEALSGMYEKPSVNNKVHLMKKLFNLKMTEGIVILTVSRHKWINLNGLSPWLKMETYLDS